MPPKRARQARRTDDDDASPSTYEREETVNMYLEFHYANTMDLFAKGNFVPADALDFARRVTRRAVELGRERASRRKEGNMHVIRALDVGCAVGGSAFHLAKGFDEVVAFDFSRAFIDACKRMREERFVDVQLPDTGNYVHEVRCERPCSDAEARKVRFHVGDACEMVRDAEMLGKFDCVIMANLLCRLPRPRACLDGLKAVTSVGSQVFIFTPWSWLDEYTPEAEERLDEESFAAEMHERGFSLVGKWEEPCFIREHTRKGQYIVSQAHWYKRQNSY